jgi:asparagine synthase (glutamine-hydrolysing)
MCGFVGFTNSINNSNKVIEACAEKIRHRGPDSGGFYIDDGIAMGFRRLSIIDITDSGDQPIFNEDKSKVLMFNGEIYNYQGLREDLLKAGHAFTTHTDSEVVLHGYEEYGEDLLPKLRGMFAFIIWDKNTRELFGARDFFGIKPVYYAVMGGNNSENNTINSTFGNNIFSNKIYGDNSSGESTFFVGSEIKSFLPHPAFKKELNTAALENYLTFQYSPTNETFFKNVYKLPPAHWFRYKNGKLTTERYWDVHFNPDESMSLDSAVKNISDIFKDSVKAHKIADVEVGSFLSSGVDSSYAAAESNVDKTFTVGFGEDERYNEIGWAKDFSRFIGKQNISKVITAKEYWDILPKIQYHMDEPLADASCVALYFVCNTAARYVKVVLSGEGADEIFGGYNIYKEPSSVPAYNAVPRPIRRAIGKCAALLPKKHGVNFLIRRGKDLDERFIGNAFIFDEAERKKLLKITTSAPSYTAITKPLYDKVRGADPVTQMQYLDLHLWMVGDILLKADKMSMANSLELRVPFLDKEVMATAERIPAKWRVTKENTKYAMRKAAEAATPARTAQKKKLGFPVPIRVWLREEKYQNKLREAFTSQAAQQFFNCEELIKLLDLHKSGEYDYSRKIWTVYIFLVWHGVFFGEN